jgi:16S rRNA (cytosine967-C5)-methyltransferase
MSTLSSQFGSYLLFKEVIGVSLMEEKVAVRVITKYLKKGNMARCLRDILPSSGLSKEQREETAELVHNVVRWKKLYGHMIDIHGLKSSPETYVKLAMNGSQAEASSYPFEYRYSCSMYVANILKDHGEWAEFLNETPPTTLCVNFNKSTIDDVMSILQQETLPAERSLLTTAIITSSISKYSKVIQQRFAHVQDESSQLVSSLTASLGESIFDYCAGNGGKSLAIASITRNGKKLHAYEMNTVKRKTLKRRCNEYNANVIIEDHPAGKKFDVVLVDAPCTGLGAARRNPEAKYVESPDDLPQTQLSILQQAAENVKSGGIIFYAVCTMTPEETTQVIQTFVKKNEITLFPFDELIHKEFLLKNKYGTFTTLPRGDVFFLSVLKKEH